MHGRLLNGHKAHILKISDDINRQALRMVVDISNLGVRVWRTLKNILKEYGYPPKLCADNSTKFCLFFTENFTRRQ